MQDAGNDSKSLSSEGFGKRDAGRERAKESPQALRVGRIGPSAAKETPGAGLAARFAGPAFWPLLALVLVVFGLVNPAKKKKNGEWLAYFVLSQHRPRVMGFRRDEIVRELHTSCCRPCSSLWPQPSGSTWQPSSDPSYILTLGRSSNLLRQAHLRRPMLEKIVSK